MTDTENNDTTVTSTSRIAGIFTYGYTEQMEIYRLLSAMVGEDCVHKIPYGWELYDPALATEGVMIPTHYFKVTGSEEDRAENREMVLQEISTNDKHGRAKQPPLTVKVRDPA